LSGEDKTRRSSNSGSDSSETLNTQPKSKSSADAATAASKQNQEGETTAITTESPLGSSYAPVEKVPEPHKNVFTEADLQVKIADLGNACWTVSFIQLKVHSSSF
jgi:hypothetical protein